MTLRKTITTNKVKKKTLLVDGEGLLKQGFYGTKSILTDKGRVGTIYHFINTIKKFISEHGITKIVVFWEGENSRLNRQKLYPYYKTNRGDKNEEEQNDINRQRVRIKQYLEELYIRQVELSGSEADDCIAYYSFNSENEDKIIMTNDRDLLQLLSKNVNVYLIDKRILVTDDNFSRHFGFHKGNVVIIKMIAGDTADNISGIDGIGESKLLNLFPTLKTDFVSYEWIKDRSHELILEGKSKKTLEKLLNGTTKWGDYGDSYFQLMDKIINLKNYFISDDNVPLIEEIINGLVCPDGRGGVNAIMKLMVEDGISELFPKNDSYFFEFWSSFISIINKEKKEYEQR
jgi:5'-3' exonuclease